MQKILIISNVFPLETNYSRGCYILSQAKLLRTKNVDIKILNPLPMIPGIYSKYDQRFIGINKVKIKRIVDDFEVFHPKYFRFPGKLFTKFNYISQKSVYERTINWLKDWSPDIIHLHGFHPLIKTSINLSKKFNSKLYVTVHGWDFDIGINNKNIRQMLMNNTDNIDGLCVVNESHFSIAKKFFQNKKIHLIPCHLEINDKFRREIKIYNNTNKDKLKILFPSNPNRKEKNYTLFTKTVDELTKRGWEIETKFLENIPREEIISKFIWADIVLVTSLREGGPLVTKEAIFCGTRVACTNVGDSCEWLPQECISSNNSPISLAICVENSLGLSAEMWKIPKKYNKSNVLNKLTKLYQID